MAVTTSQVQALYIAYFNRPADFFGLTFQTAQANQFGLQFVADQFSKSPEYLATYAGKSVGEVVDTIYMNLFGRHAEPAGLKFWGDLLTDPKSGYTIGNAAITIATGAINDDKVSVANKLVAANAFYASLDTSPEIVGYSGTAANQVLKTWLAGITDQASLDAAITPAALLAVSTAATEAHDGLVSINTNLTTGVDLFVGTAGSDTINGLISQPSPFGPPTAGTLNALDSIDGGAGIDTLNINDLDGNGLPSGVTIKNIENIVIRAASNADFDFSTTAGVSSVKVTQAGSVDLTVASGAAVSVSGATGNIYVDGGTTQSVTTGGSNHTTQLSGASGAVNVAGNLDNGTIYVNGGTTVAVVATDVTYGSINIGNDTAHTPTGAITVDVTGAAAAAGEGFGLGNINVQGGTTVSVKETATSDASAAAEDTNGSTITQASVTVNGTDKTTSVSVTQSAEVAADHAVTIVDPIKEVQVVTFGALTKGESVSVHGLTFTAGIDLTAAQVAAAFANLSTTSTQGSSQAANGIYSGISSGNFSTGAVVANGTAQTVTYTAAASKGNVDTLIVGGTHVAATTVAAVTNGQAADGYAGTLGVAAGWVGINGNITGTDVLKTVSINSWGPANEGNSYVASDALTSLTLANSKNALDVFNNTATSLNLSLNHVGNFDTLTGAAINLGTTYTTLNLATTGADSRAALAANGVDTLVVSGTNAANLTGSSLTGLKTVTVTGSAGLNVDASLAANLASVDSSATTGSVTAKINAATATYVGGAGNDSVTLSTTTTTKAISLGAGNDTLTLAAGTTTLTAVMDGGAGTDTLKLAAADAATASATTAFATKFTGFEKLSLGAAVSGVTNTVDLSNLNNLSYVISAGSSAGVTAPVVPTAAVTQGVAATSLEATTYTFSAGLNAGESFTVDGKTVTASATMTATEVATFFRDTSVVTAGLTASGVFATPTDWSGATVGGSTNTLSFTNTVQGNVTDFTDAATAHGVGIAGTGALVLTKVANAGTLELTGAGSNATVTMLDATGTADSFNIVTKVGTSGLNFGNVNAAGVESISLTVTDTAPTDAFGNASIQTATLNLTDAALKSLVITGNSALTLSLDTSVVALATIDGSAMTGKLIAATNGTVSTVLTGGAAGDILTANGNADTLNGGAGADTLIVGVNGDLTKMVGGAGNDVFNVANATSNVNSYATIADATAGDKIVFAASGTSFIASKVSLGDTAVFQDLANAAIATTDVGQISWFQFAGNTYVIENVSDSATAFQNGGDIIVKITGAVDLGTASFSASAHSLLFV
jgi:hypothetical protein